MKKSALLLLCVVMLLTAVSCKNETKDAISNNSETQSSPSDTDSSYSLSDILDVFRKEKDDKLSHGETLRSGEMNKKSNFKITDENGNVLITSSDIKNVCVGFNVVNNYFLEIQFSENGREKFHNATKNNIGKALYFYVDEELLTSPIVNEEITTDRAIISGDMDKRQVLELYDMLT